MRASARNRNTKNMYLAESIKFNDVRITSASEAELLALTSDPYLPKIRLEEALPSLQTAVIVTPTDVIARAKLGLTFRLLDRFKEAEAELFEAARLVSGPGSEVIYNLLGLTLCEQGYFNKALPLFEAALRQNPNHKESRENQRLANLLLERDGPSIELYTRDHIFSSDEMAYLFKVSLFDQKKYSEAWDWIRQYRRHTGSTTLGPEWQGDDPHGKTILIIHEFMGLGDGFFNIRFIPLLAAMGARVIILAPLTLARLFSTVPGVSTVASEVERLPPYDLTAYMLDLPHFLMGDLAVPPTPVPFLTAFSEDVAVWRERLRNVSGLKIGIAYSGGIHPKRIAFHRHFRRHCALDQFSSLADLPGVTLINLQMDAAKSQISSSGVPVLDYTENINDYADTAALICNLDLVITVDTSIAHCAGALGKPVWILLQYGIAALWPTDDSDYPWYPSARLFHQPEPGNWELTFAAVALEVGDLLKKLSSVSAGDGVITSS